jgi:hypothetical protein
MEDEIKLFIFLLVFSYLLAALFIPEESRCYIVRLFENSEIQYYIRGVLYLIFLILMINFFVRASRI